MSMLSILAFVSATAAQVPASVLEQSRTVGNFDQKVMLTDQQLAMIRGGIGWSLTEGTLVQLSDTYSLAELRLSGSIGRTQMDVWWGSTGSQLIANSVRNGLD